MYPDAAPCGAVPWVGNLLGAGDMPVAIFHGRQTQSGEGCNHPDYGQTNAPDQGRRVMLYTYEFRSYGPDGIAVTYQRNNLGVMEKRFPIQDYQESIVAVAGPGIVAPSTTAYTAFGTPTPDGTETSKGTSPWLNQSRTAYMDKTIDWETAPFAGMEEFRLYDVSARKLNPATGTFLTPDPLWMVSPGVGSYTYAGQDPINSVDPSGLLGLATSGSISTGFNYPNVEVYAERWKPFNFYVLNRDQYEMLYYWNKRGAIGGYDIADGTGGYGGPSGRGGRGGTYYQENPRSNNGQTKDAPQRTIESPDIDDAPLITGNYRYIGPSLVVVGLPILPKVRALGSVPGTSVASEILRKVITKEVEKPLPSFVWKKGVGFVFRTTRSLGAFFARAIPVAGWALIILDVATSDELKAFSEGGATFFRMQQQAREDGDATRVICFAEGTTIQTPSGLIPIEKLQTNDIVYSFNFEEETVELDTITNIVHGQSNKLLQIKTNAQEIIVTEEHPFWVQDKGWVAAKHLEPTFLLKTMDSSFDEYIVSVRNLAENTEVYNIEVKRNHNYFVSSSGILVHNKYIRKYKHPAQPKEKP